MKLFNMDFDEWIQNDWESDDFIEQEARKKAQQQNIRNYDTGAGQPETDDPDDDLSDDYDDDLSDDYADDLSDDYTDDLNDDTDFTWQQETKAAVPESRPGFWITLLSVLIVIVRNPLFLIICLVLILVKC